MKTRKPLVVGNWKMNGDIAANEHLFTALRAAIDVQLLGQVDVAVCPPFVYLGQAGAWLADTGVVMGAQNVAARPDGALTGEVSARMLADLNCRWVIIGHSERRTLFAETDQLVAQKVSLALEHGLGVIVCVGETLDERESGKTGAVIERQVAAVAPLAVSAPEGRFVIAYEPVWAIGTGRTATPEQAQQVHADIRTQLAAAGAPADGVRLLYGGSMKPGNAASLLAMGDIDGGLIGGASLVAEEFVAILRAAAQA